MLIIWAVWKLASQLRVMYSIWQLELFHSLVNDKPQYLVSDSTTEAKYKALMKLPKKLSIWDDYSLSWMFRVQLQLSILLHTTRLSNTQDLAHASSPTQQDIDLYYDNQDSIKLALNPIFHARTKHIEAKHNFVWEQRNQPQIRFFESATCWYIYQASRQTTLWSP